MAPGGAKAARTTNEKESRDRGATERQKGSEAREDPFDRVDAAVDATTTERPTRTPWRQTGNCRVRKRSRYAEVKV